MIGKTIKGKAVTYSEAEKDQIQKETNDFFKGLSKTSKSFAKSKNYSYRSLLLRQAEFSHKEILELLLDGKDKRKNTNKFNGEQGNKSAVL